MVAYLTCPTRRVDKGRVHAGVDEGGFLRDGEVQKVCEISLEGILDWAAFQVERAVGVVYAFRQVELMDASQ